MKFLLVLALVAAANAAIVPFYNAGENGVRGQYIVILEDGVSVDSAVSRFTSDASHLGISASVSTRYDTVFNGFVAKVDVEGKGLQLLLSLPGVKFVEEDEIISVDAAVGSWGVDRIDQRNRILDNQMILNGYGAGTHIYVIDTGINPYHEDFGGRASVATDILNDGQNGIDCNGHGTHCAGTAASNIYGVAREASVYGIRTLSCSGSGYKSDTNKGLDWVAANGKRPAIASLSLGGSYSLTQNLAVKTTREAGVVVVVSAGNNDYDACRNSPASAPEAITVGSTDSSDTRSYFSNYGTCVDLFAPGSSITSLDYRSNSDTSVKSGTSMSCPHVAGIAAVLAGQQSSYDSELVYSQVVSTATSGVITDPETGSPNLLAYAE